jgi:hypothetical protein
MRRFGLISSTTALIALLVSGPSVSARPQAEALLTELSSPKGLAVDTDGNPVVGQGAFGPPGPILTYIVRGRDRGATVPVLEEAAVIDIAIGPDGAGWAIGSDGNLYREAEGLVQMVLDIRAYQSTDPDPVDQDDFAEESNPYGLTVLPSGDALFADAANNDVVRVTPDGDATTVARFDLEPMSTDHLGDPGLPATLTAEAVPTSVTIGPDGFAYVGELKGYPFRPGTSHVWRVDPDAEGAWCSVSTPDPDCSVDAGGFTAIQDIAFHPHNGRLYVLELAADGVLAFEEGLGTGEFPDAVLLEVKRHRRTELAAGQLSQPGGIALARNGSVFVTDGVFTQGRLLRIRG